MISDSHAPESRPRAYSYVRFSTPEQQRGDSFRRQMALAREYADRHGLELDDSLDLQDLGLSAYRGANAESGRLGDFLELVRAGHIPRGSYLLVESLDRLSRQKARKALRPLEDIIEAGVYVVTLFDGRVYDLESIDGTDLLIAILFMIRAHEESETKGRRLRHAWEQKRRRAADAGAPSRLTKKAPAWLRVAGSGFAVIEEYAEVIREIFGMALEGMGTKGIAVTLNERGIAPFAWTQGRRRGERSSGWHASYVGKILANSAVIGAFVPHKEDYVDGRLVRTALDPLPGYFPAVIDTDTWAAVQALRATRKPRGAVSRLPAKNPLGGLLRCICGRSAVRANKGRGPRGQEWSYYVCSGAKEKGDARCRVKSFRAQPVEAAVLSQLPSLLRACPADAERARNLRWEIGAVSGAISTADKAISELLAGAEGTGLSPAIRARVDALESRRAELRREAQWLQGELEQIAPGLAQRRAAALADALEAADAISLPMEPVNAVCRSLFTHGEIDPAEDVIRLHWRQGGVGIVDISGAARKGRKAGLQLAN